MTATYTFDIFSSLDGFGSHDGNSGKQGPELEDHRLAIYSAEQQMVFGANTYREFVEMLATSTEGPEVGDSWVTRMTSMPDSGVDHTGRTPRLAGRDPREG